MTATRNKPTLLSDSPPSDLTVVHAWEDAAIKSIEIDTPILNHGSEKLRTEITSCFRQLNVTRARFGLLNKERMDVGRNGLASVVTLVSIPKRANDSDHFDSR